MQNNPISKALENAEEVVQEQAIWENPIVFSELETPEIPVNLLPDNLLEYP